jgi:hypothetical protein
MQEKRAPTLTIFARVERLAVHRDFPRRFRGQDAHDGIGVIDPFRLKGETAGEVCSAMIFAEAARMRGAEDLK